MHQLAKGALHYPAFLEQSKALRLFGAENHLHNPMTHGDNPVHKGEAIKAAIDPDGMQTRDGFALPPDAAQDFLTPFPFWCTCSTDTPRARLTLMCPPSQIACAL